MPILVFYVKMPISEYIQSMYVYLDNLHIFEAVLGMFSVAFFYFS